MKEFFENKIVWYVVFAIVALLIIKSVLSKIGLVNDAKDDKRESQQSNPDAFLTGNAKQSTAKQVLKTDKEISRLADEILISMFGEKSILKDVLTLGLYGATVGYGTDEARFFNTLYQIKSKAQFNQLVKKVRERYSVDLFTSIVADLTKSEFDKFSNYVSSLPTILTPK